MVEEARNERKATIMNNRKVIVMDGIQRDNNKYEFGTLQILSWKCYRWIKGIACYIKNNYFPRFRIHKKDHFNQYTWIDISDINGKNIYIAICYFHLFFKLL